MIYNRILILLFSFLFASCDFLVKKQESNSENIARVGDYYLDRAEIYNLVPPGTPEADSLLLTQNFIDNWVRQKVVLVKAESNLNSDQKDVDRQLQEYKNSLIVYAFEQELIRQKLDTAVTANEIEKFYERNLGTFELKDNIIKMIYLKVSNDTPKLDKVKQWYRSGSAKDRQLLEDYARQYALNYYFDDETWLIFDDLLKEVPLTLYDKEQFLKNNRFIEISDSVNTYLVNIKGFKIKSGTSPLAFEKENIKSMILNQRKLQLLKEMEQDAYQEAVRKSTFEIYRQ
ncbi:MAG: hypothetical protein ACR2GN_08115 [Bacteroidia bacterium]